MRGSEIDGIKLALPKYKDLSFLRLCLGLSPRHS